MTARYEEYVRNEVYHSYIARSLQLIPQSQHLIPTYEEILNPKEVDVRTGDQIAADIINKAGLTFGSKP